jgi:crotonobetainyl-CoA:carnitine CoA-transferase CaiB-like acyl-CoA transferase
MGALSGIRVLDLGVLAQAHQAALLLGDMGATVIKVELPGIGDQLDGYLPPLAMPKAATGLDVTAGKKASLLTFVSPRVVTCFCG